MTTLREMSSKWYSETVAQEIRKDIDQWLGSQKIDIACKKWPWELLQNAFDAAISSGQKDLNIEILVASNGNLVFSHDGGRGAFTEKEFFRLLTRGTTKDSPDEEQEGRFGEGFVVTHVLSEVVDVTGSIGDERGFRPFKITIDRRGTWEEISKKIDELITKIDSLDSRSREPCGKAYFEYSYPHSPTLKAIEEGLSSIQDLIPYVIAIMFVRSNIAVHVKVERPKSMSTFYVMQDKSQKIDKNVSKVVIRQDCSGMPAQFHLLMFETTNPGHYLALKTSDGTDCVLTHLLDENNSVPRLFTNFPLLHTVDLPLPCVIFGKLGRKEWQVDKERFDLNYQNKTTILKLEQDMLGLAGLWKWLDEKKVLNRHRLYDFKRIADRSGVEEWEQILVKLAEELKPLHAVECSDCMPREVAEVVFPSVPDDVAIDVRADLVKDTWKLYNFAGFDVPREETMLDWFKIAQGWKSIGVDLKIRTLEDILESVSSHGNLDSLLTEIGPQIDTRDKCLKFLKLVTLAVLNYVTKVRNTPDFVEQSKIYCDQRGNLRKKDRDLVIDLEISESLKNAAELLGYPLREKLLAKEQTIPDADKWFRENLQLQTWTDLDVVNNIFDYLHNFEQHQTDRKKDLKKPTDYKNGLVEFTYFLVRSVDKPQILENNDLRELPLIWADDEKLETIKNKQLERCYLPVSLCDTEFQRFVNLFPPSLRLSDIYTKDNEVETFKQFMVEHKIAVASPFYETQLDLDADDTCILSPIASVDRHSPQKVPLKAVAGFGQLLSTIGRGGTSPTPESLLEFVLRYLAMNDGSWRTETYITSKCTQPGHKECTVQIYPSEWLLKLKRTAWVPTDGGFATPKGDNLEPIAAKIMGVLDSELARELLSKLGCDSLNLAILSLSGADEALLPTIRSDIAGIVSFAKNKEDLSKIKDLVRKNAETFELIGRNQVLGDIVQRVMAKAFRDRGFLVQDDEIKNLKGHDFKLKTGREPTEEDILLLVRDIWVEVKETNQNEIRMTEPQAVASVQRKRGYVLCVLDLRGQEELRTSMISGAKSVRNNTLNFNDFADQIVPGIEPFIRITHVGDYIGPKLNEYVSVTSDENSGVRIELGPQPRFIVSSSIWADKAKTLSEWIRETSTSQSLV